MNSLDSDRNCMSQIRGGYASIDGNGRPEDRKFDDEARVDEEIARVRMFGLPRINVNLGH